MPTRLALHTAPLPITSIQGTLALDVAVDHGPPEIGCAPGRPGGDVVHVDGQVRRRLEQWCHRYAQAVVEIVSGDRPVAQVLRWTTPEVYDSLGRRAQPSPLRAATAPARAGAAPRSAHRSWGSARASSRRTGSRRRSTCGTVSGHGRWPPASS